MAENGVKKPEVRIKEPQNEKKDSDVEDLLEDLGRATHKVKKSCNHIDHTNPVMMKSRNT